MVALAIASWIAFVSQAAQVTLQWVPSPDAGVIGYRVYAQQTGAAGAAVADVGNSTIASVDNLVEGATYTIFLTAYDGGLVESDPSNQVSYTVPITTSTNEPPPPPPPPTDLSGYALQFSGFTHAKASYSPRGTMSTAGEIYPSGATITLSASAEAGYSCTGWMINNVFYRQNPMTLTLNQHSLVAPVLKKNSGGASNDKPATSISMKIGMANGRPTVSVGGEMGAWVLEGATQFGTWTQVASGLTTDQVSLLTRASHEFYRVRTTQLTALDQLP